LALCRAIRETRITFSARPPWDTSASAADVEGARTTPPASRRPTPHEDTEVRPQSHARTATPRVDRSARVCLDERYDDGGFSGGNTDRPAFKRLVQDVADGKVDCIVVYEIDRLSRSLMDFAQIMEALETNGVSVVSVTQQFNTTSSMGRLTLNILLSFAQFEREIIGAAEPPLCR
jgi:hypothetical protein